MRSVALTPLLLAIAFAQAPDLKTVSAGARTFQSQIRNNVLRAAEKMPEEKYSFRASSDVRTFAQLLGHIADAEYLFCSGSLKEKNPAPGIEKSKTTKQQVLPALKEAFDYCEKAYSALTDENAKELIKAGPNERTRLSLLEFNIMHAWEHYGNLVTYMRLGGVVPPTSEKK